MKDAQPKAIFLKDYQTPNFWITETKLTFDLHETYADVISELVMERNVSDYPNGNDPLVLDGQCLELKSVALDGVVLAEDAYSTTAEDLTIPNLPNAFVLTVVTRIKPQENTALEGLYKSSKMFCTQCEAEGFRRITYYLDRPDVMSIFETTVMADKARYPVLLSNGNLVAEKSLADGRHLTTWHDPHKKPCYLFALVAGDLSCIEDSFTTMSGEEVALKIFVEPQNIDKCDYAMDSLKRSMKWDEEVYGREYDLNIFNIVAVDDFNMGAMENKSLNIFNSSCVLANPETATDTAYQRIEAVVAHEYFHNWSGNRVTCRDWFQLSLKEGFTVFRDAEFSADMGSRTVKRIEDATLLRTVQFAEDAGPMAHPIRPESFIEISNFYTVTIYEKGAEIVRMIHNLLGTEKFRAGSDLYFQRHDGQAVTTDEFVKAMEDASGIDLTLFRNWYRQAGTPEVHVFDAYDEDAQTYTLTLKQSCPATPESSDKEPFHIPIAIGLLDASGRELPLQLSQGGEFNENDKVIGLREREETFVFENVPQRPTPSLLRGFSAPVKLHFPYSRDQLLFLMGHDTDGFNRWDAGQTLATNIILELAENVKSQIPLTLDERLVTVFSDLLTASVEQGAEALDKAMVANMLTLPSVAYLMEQQSPAFVHALYSAREFVKTELARQLEGLFAQVYQANKLDGDYQPHPDHMARRALKNLCLDYLMDSGNPAHIERAESQFINSNNMTDQSAALRALVNSGDTEVATSALDRFYQQWKHDSLVVNQWLSIQAASDKLCGLEQVKTLMQHDVFDWKNPNKVRAVVSVFAGQNFRHFHGEQGAGYQWLADIVIKVDGLNPQIASRLVGPLTKWKRLAPENGQWMKSALEKIQKHNKLSKDVYEVVSKTLVN